MNANIRIIQEDLIAVNFNHVDFGYIKDIQLQPGVNIKGKDATLSFDGILLLNKVSPVYEVLLKMMPRVMKKSDELLRDAKNELDQQGCSDEYEVFYSSILGWEIKRRQVKAEYLKQSTKETFKDRINKMFRKGVR